MGGPKKSMAKPVSKEAKPAEAVPKGETGSKPTQEENVKNKEAATVPQSVWATFKLNYWALPKGRRWLISGLIFTAFGLLVFAAGMVVWFVNQPPVRITITQSILSPMYSENYDELTNEVYSKAYAKLAGMYDLDLDVYADGVTMVSWAEDERPEDEEYKSSHIFFNMTLPKHPHGDLALPKVNAMTGQSFVDEATAVQKMIIERYPEKKPKPPSIASVDTTISFGNGTIHVIKDYNNGTKDIIEQFNHTNETHPQGWIEVISVERKEFPTGAAADTAAPELEDKSEDKSTHTEL